MKLWETFPVAASTAGDNYCKRPEASFRLSFVSLSNSIFSISLLISAPWSATMYIRAMMILQCSIPLPSNYFFFVLSSVLLAADTNCPAWTFDGPFLQMYSILWWLQKFQKRLEELHLSASRELSRVISYATNVAPQTIGPMLRPRILLCRHYPCRYWPALGGFALDCTR